ncbi:nucleotidyltransferase domain-containing protein [Candidatus Peregrinibacteria bacterium]|nr:nucleotidyltransferase domain-containing protein [Candidatus Peregrinibacteria bacterium]
MKSVIEHVAQKYGLEMVILFGSVAKNRANKNSDVDMVVLSHSKLVLKKELELRHELQNLFQKEVDLVFLQDAGPLLLGQIAKDGRLIFGTKKKFDDFRIYAMKSYLDFEPYFRLQEKVNRYKLKHA